MNRRIVLPTVLLCIALGCGGAVPVASPPSPTRPAIIVSLEWERPQSLTVAGPHADRRVSSVSHAEGYLEDMRGDTVRLEVVRLAERSGRPLKVPVGSQLTVVLGPEVLLLQRPGERSREPVAIAARPPTRAELGKAGLGVAAALAIVALVFIGVREAIDAMLSAG